MDKLLIISSDGHVTAPMEGYRSYLDPKFREVFDEMQTDDETIQFPDMLDPDLWGAYKTRIIDSGLIDGRHDPDLRLKALAAEGIVGEILFPDNAPFGAAQFGAARKIFTPELDLAGARAYNRWIIDFCDGRPGLAPQFIASLYDIDAAVKEIYWAKEHGAKGIFMPGMDNDRPFYWDPIYEPFWAACADVRLPLNFHGGTGMPQYRTMSEEVPYVVRARLANNEFGFFAHRPLAWLLWSGVLERYPDLTLVFTEQHSDWLTGATAMMDHSYQYGLFDTAIQKYVPKLPSEYIERQVWLGSSLLARGELRNSGQFGRRKMMFGADFPHPEGTYGKTKDWLRATVGESGMAESEVRTFLGENAARVFGFDLDALSATAEIYGPDPAEILEPLPGPTKDYFRGSDVHRPTVVYAAAD